MRMLKSIELDPSTDFATKSVLGMRSISAEDIFMYTFKVRDDLQPNLNENHIATKREVLKVTMSLFDRMGFVSFFLVHDKVLMKDVWA